MRRGFASFEAVRSKPLTAIGGPVWILQVRVQDSFGQDALRIFIEPAPKLDAPVPPPFRKKQAQYLAFIYHYTKIHGRAPAALDLRRYF